MNIDPKDVGTIFDALGMPQYKETAIALLTVIEEGRAASHAAEKAKHDEHIAALKSATVELELIRMALQGVATAISNYTHESFHTVR